MGFNVLACTGRIQSVLIYSTLVKMSTADMDDQPKSLTPAAISHKPEMATEHTVTSEATSTSEKRPQDGNDVEAQASTGDSADGGKMAAFKALGWLDRFLALWIFLAMAVGIILGNFVPSTGPSLQKGKFVGVSVPIGMCPLPRAIVPR